MALSTIPVAQAHALSSSEIQSQIRSVRATLQDISKDLNLAERTLAQTDAAIARHTAALRVAAKRRTVLQAAIGARASQLYIYGSMTQNDIMAGDGVATYVDRMAYLQQMQQGDRGLLEEVVALQRRSDTESALLRSAQAQASRAEASLATRRADLSSKLAELTRLEAYITSSRQAVRGSRAGIRGFLCPVIGSHVVSNNFGDPRPGGPHQGNDINANSGQWVRAAIGGTVVDTPYGSWWGIGVVIRDVTGTEWWYAHLSVEQVSPGERVNGGDLIARVGCTGTCYGSHLHFEWHPGGGSARDPYGILSSAC